MECTLATLIACFSWANLYIDSGVAIQDASLHETTYNVEVFDEAPCTLCWLERMDRSAWNAENPYGRIAIGHEIELRNVSFRLEASHISSMRTGNDRGVNAISLHMRWYPFRSQ